MVRGCVGGALYDDAGGPSEGGDTDGPVEAADALMLLISTVVSAALRTLCCLRRPRKIDYSSRLIQEREADVIDSVRSELQRYRASSPAKPPGEP